jgi:RND family efflux transporter MFP subunit
MISRLKPITGSIMMMLTVTIMMTACGPQDSQPGAQTTVPESSGIPIAASSLYPAELRLVRPSFRYPAVVEAVQYLKARAEISAVIEAVHFSPGELVEKGQLLIEFRVDDFQQALESANAGLQAAKAAAEQTAGNLARAQELKPKDYISAQDFDRAKARADSTAAAVLVAESELDKAKINLARTRLHAPFSGKISRFNYSVGEYVMSQSPTQPEPLFELVQLDPIYVKANVELGVYNRAMLIRKEMESSGENVQDLVIHLELAGKQEYPVTGNFVAWDNTSSVSTGTIAGRVLFDNPDGLLLAGESVIIKGETIVQINRIVIPQKAVVLDQQGHYVKIVDDDNTVQRRNIEVGIRVGSDWSLLSGLEEGDRVIIEGTQNFREGAEVEVQP